MAFTFFFRDKEVLELVAQHVIPDLKTRMYINIWDAGCANGPEPYSLAITLRENMGRFLFRNVRIYATDIDESGQFGAVIARGVYSDQEVKRIPPDILNKYFEPIKTFKVFKTLQVSDQDLFLVKAELRQAVHYQTHDLLSLQPVRTELGLIVCKNVLLHLTAEQRVAVVKMFHAALISGGYLVTEQTQKLPPGTEHLFGRVTEAGSVFQKVTVITQPTVILRRAFCAEESHPSKSGDSSLRSE